MVLKKSKKVKEAKEVKEVKLFADLNKISKLGEGDIIVMKLKGAITKEAAESLKKQLKIAFPDNKLLILSEGANLFPLPKRQLNSMGWVEK